MPLREKAPASNEQPVRGLSVCNDFDFRFRISRHINFYPYVGEEYPVSSPKILILGHSHYGPAEWDKDHDTTRGTIIEHLDHVAAAGTAFRWGRCFRRMGAVIEGNGYYHSDAIWSKLSFFNFFQIHVGSDARDKSRIAPEVVENSRKAFLEVLDVLRPDAVIVWGNDLWYRQIPEQGWEWVDRKRGVGRYAILPNTLVWKTTHPSAARFSIDTTRGQWLEILPLIPSSD